MSLNSTFPIRTNYSSIHWRATAAIIPSLSIFSIAILYFLDGFALS